MANYTRWRDAALAIALASCAAAQTFAQSAAPAVTSSDAGLQEIIVTAERHEESAQKAPLTIQVLGADQVKQSGLTAVTDLSKLTTGLEIGVGGGSTQLFIRGVGDFSFDARANPGVAFNVDGVYVGRSDGLAGNFYDISRVEVLKGPQGTLYGRNANGGSINVITNEPRLGETSGEFNESVGNYGLFEESGAINVPIGETLAIRTAFNVVNRRGYLSDGTDDDVEQSGRIRLKWQPSDDIRVLLNTDYSHIGGDNGGYTYLPQRPGSSPWEGVGDPAAIAYRDQLRPPLFLGPLLDPTVPDTSLDAKLWNVSGQIDWNLGFANLTLLPAYRYYDTYSNAYLGFNYIQPDNGHQDSFEARLGNSSEALTWVVGTYYFRDSDLASSTVFNSNIIQNTLFDFDSKTTAYAGFGQATLRVIDGLRLIGGLRYTYEQRSLDGIYVDNRPAPYGPGVGTILEKFPGHINFNGTTYKAGIEYDLATENLLYLTVSTGFKAGGLNATVAPEATYQPEKLRSVELGSRNRFLDDRLQINASLYHWNYSNLQDQRITFDPTQTINLVTFNVGDATIKGATLDVVAKATRADTLSASVEYADSRYDSFRVQVPTALAFPGAIGCPGSISGSYTVSNCSGYQVARVPLWTGLLAYDHAFQLPNDATLKLAGSMKSSSSRWLATDFVESERAAAYSVFDANLIFTPASNRYSVGAFVRNIGDRAYYTGGFEHPFIPGLFAANIAAPRTFGMQASIRFGN
jgi:iron complex outermembrane recepter protein